MVTLCGGFDVGQCHLSAHDGHRPFSVRAVPTYLESELWLTMIPNSP